MQKKDKISGVVELILEKTAEVLFARKEIWLTIFLNVLQKETTLLYFNSSLHRWTISFIDNISCFQQKPLCICKITMWWWFWTITQNTCILQILQIVRLNCQLYCEWASNDVTSLISINLNSLGNWPVYSGCWEKILLKGFPLSLPAMVTY